MNEEPALIEITMVRETLADWPVLPLPGGFSLRLYRPGDESAWVRIHEASERFHAVTPALFQRAFGGGEAHLAERQLFLCDALGREVGTATAWFNDDYHGRRWGRIHWVAVAESHQGRGLGRALVSAAGERLRQLGHERVYLKTESVRLPAIRLYLSLGFRPEIKHEADRREWEALHLNFLKAKRCTVKI